MRFVRDPANRRPVIVVVIATLLLLLAVGNLVVVAFDPLVVTPQEHPVTRWSLGRDAGEHDVDAHLEWAFVVEAGGRRVVDLDVGMPYRVTVDHREGQASFSTFAALRVDGETVASASRSTSATPGMAGEPFTDEVDLGERMGRIVLERPPDEDRFVVLLTLDWSHVQSDADSTRFDVEIGPPRVEPADLPGIPGCTSMGCAQGLFVVALVAQGGGVFWVMQHWSKGAAPDPERVRSPHARRPPARRTDKKK